MRQKIGRACMVLGALLILAAAALLAYNKWDASRADKASQEVLGELEQTLNAAIEEKAKSDTVALQPELDPTQEMTVTELNGWDYIGYLSIPSIELELPVMSQWSYAGLKIAPGRYSGSTYADNMVVCAHNYAKPHQVADRGRAGLFYGYGRYALDLRGLLCGKPAAHAN